MLTVLWEDVPEDSSQQMLLERLFAIATASANIPASAEVTVLLTGDERLRALNRAYRDKDAPTDVLSFAQREARVGDAGYKPTLPEEGASNASLPQTKDSSSNSALSHDVAGCKPALPEEGASNAMLPQTKDSSRNSALSHDVAGCNPALPGEGARNAPLPQTEDSSQNLPLSHDVAGCKPALPEEGSGCWSTQRAEDYECLGDIAISLQRVTAQAASYGHSEDRELGYLFVHGFLHLIGHTHAGEPAYMRMREWEEGILAAAGLPRNLEPE